MPSGGGRSVSRAPTNDFGASARPNSGGVGPRQPTAATSGVTLGFVAPGSNYAAQPRPPASQRRDAEPGAKAAGLAKAALVKLGLLEIVRRVAKGGQALSWEGMRAAVLAPDMASNWAAAAGELAEHGEVVRPPAFATVAHVAPKKRFRTTALHRSRGAIGAAMQTSECAERTTFWQETPWVHFLPGCHDVPSVPDVAAGA